MQERVKLGEKMKLDKLKELSEARHRPSASMNDLQRLLPHLDALIKIAEAVEKENALKVSFVKAPDCKDKQLELMKASVAVVEALKEVEEVK